MKIIISPAKKMNIDVDCLGADSRAVYLEETLKIVNTLKAMNCDELKTLWKCNDKLAELNYQRIEAMKTDDFTIEKYMKNQTPAILAYEGIQYQYMAPKVFTRREFDYVNENLRILSAFYGLLKPFDGVVPYRLEMQAKLKIGPDKDLYQFWGGKLAEELSRETDVVLNLASREYSRAVEPHLPPQVKFITCVFGQFKDDDFSRQTAKMEGMVNPTPCRKIVEKGTMCKMARGQMVRWLAENNITKEDDVKSFSELGYIYNEEYSNEQNFVFVKK